MKLQRATSHLYIDAANLTAACITSPCSDCGATRYREFAYVIEVVLANERNSHVGYLDAHGISVRLNPPTSPPLDTIRPIGIRLVVRDSLHQPFRTQNALRHIRTWVVTRGHIHSQPRTRCRTARNTTGRPRLPFGRPPTPRQPNPRRKHPHQQHGLLHRSHAHPASPPRPRFPGDYIQYPHRRSDRSVWAGEHAAAVPLGRGPTAPNNAHTNFDATEPVLVPSNSPEDDCGPHSGECGPRSGSQLISSRSAGRSRRPGSCQRGGVPHLPGRRRAAAGW